MNKATFDGFVKRAQEAGISAVEASNLFKQATGMDPAAMAQGGDPSQGAGGPPPGHPHHGGGHGGPDMGGGMGVPPELEQLIQQLPPEVLQQLVQEIEAEMQGQGGGSPHGHHGGGDPSQGAGGPPPGAGGGQDPAAMMAAMGKQGSAKILAKEAAYIEGFAEHGLKYGFGTNDVKQLYKKALELMDVQPTSKVAPVQNKLSDKQASHFEGFMSQAKAYGISDKEAADVYRRTFSK